MRPALQSKRSVFARLCFEQASKTLGEIDAALLGMADAALVKEGADLKARLDCGEDMKPTWFTLEMPIGEILEAVAARAPAPGQPTLKSMVSGFQKALHCQTIRIHDVGIPF